MGTFGKALGTSGAFVAGSQALIEALIQFSRSYIYTTALPPAVAGATLAAFDVLEKESWRREKLQSLIYYFHTKIESLSIEFTKNPSPIQIIMIGSSEKAMVASEKLRQKGILVAAIRPPAVPLNTARLRITLCAEHNEKDIDLLVDSLKNL